MRRTELVRRRSVGSVKDWIDWPTQMLVGQRACQRIVDARLVNNMDRPGPRLEASPEVNTRLHADYSHRARIEAKRASKRSIERLLADTNENHMDAAEADMR